jgi:hypothetical protein
MTDSVLHIPVQVPKCGSGGEGEYYKLNEHTGIKIVPNERLDIDGVDYGKLVDAEAKTMQILDKKCPGVFPKFYGIVQVKVQGRSTPLKALMMEHVPGENLGSNNWLCLAYEEEKNPNWKRVNKMHKPLNDANIFWSDDHGNNIIKAGKGKLRFIDASPRYFKWTCDKCETLTRSLLAKCKCGKDYLEVHP